ncbi:MAG: flagellar biosynthesis anti-sigma factor FlgM [Acetivibrionales bacterium]
MRINGDITKITGVYGTQKSIGKLEKTGSVSAKKDVLSISSEAKDFQTVLRALKDVPDIRQGRVNEILEKIETGSYDVTGREVAEKIVNSVFDKKA